MTSGRHSHRPDTGPVPVAGRPRDDHHLSGLPAVLHPGRATALLHHRLPQDRVPPPATSNPARRSTVPAARPRREITVYEWGPDCGRPVPRRATRCESRGTFARRAGIGGACPNCDGPVAISDLLDQAVVTIAKK